ncbi:MAG: hypothetical protein AB7L36_15335, partial [Sphingomonadaceae bacterium]
VHRLSPFRLVVDRHEPVRSPFMVWQEALAPHATRTETVTPANFEERRRDVEKLIAKAGAALRSGAHKGKLTPPKQGSPASTSTPELPLGKPGGRR